MRITIYKTKINEDNLNILVKEKAVNYEITTVDHTEKIEKLMNDLFDLKNLAEEHLYMIAVNTKAKIVGMFEISHGSVNASIANPREILIRALLCGAYGIILVHNHPSGDTTPSHEDIMTTKRINEASKMVGIKLFDHVIIGDNYTSFLEIGELT